MERNRAISTQSFPVPIDDECPLLCLVKSIIFVVVATFILYLPLGDPQGMRCTDRKSGGAVCCLCDIYRLLVKVSYKVVNIVECTLYTLLDVLYEIKLKLYALLGHIDKKDLCRSVCCKDERVKNE